ncbi:hypothetical protein KEU06_26370 [Pseudaminobacter sp. 19-2017]|uniref:UDP-3-O-(3-hydroxymyristoyl)glucosamine N-acyltransferase n=1 Tax=Pseudaminobacter soli (ex Zhang et al. 2022) TaxID=2831468 RepID=A0A942I4M3_9HYPH|nr:DapH/DapD/GlmU-related protein [Pseudaminobacter soli]MBS3652128.1 hypothetical protein [Pseudaminobacter soli]
MLESKSALFPSCSHDEGFVKTDLFHVSDFAKEAGYCVLRDAAFTQIGFLNHHGSGLLVPLHEASMIDHLTNLGDRLAVVLTTAEMAEAVGGQVGLIIADSPLDAFWRLHLAIGRRLEREQPLKPTVIAATARIHPSAHIDERGIEIGAGSVIGPNSSIIGRVIIGNEAIIGANVAIGTEGYQVARLNGQVTNVRHLGGVRVGDRVEIQAGTIINRSLWTDFTEIGDDTKVGGSAFIAHGTIIGHRCRVMTKSVICGSALIGNDAVVGVGAIVSNGISIGSGATVMISELVRHDLPEGMLQLQGRHIESRRFALIRALTN